MALFLFLKTTVNAFPIQAWVAGIFNVSRLGTPSSKWAAGLTFSGLMRLVVIDKKTRALSFWRGQGLMEIDRLLTTKSTGAVIVVKNAI